VLPVRTCGEGACFIPVDFIEIIADTPLHPSVNEAPRRLTTMINRCVACCDIANGSFYSSTGHCCCPSTMARNRIDWPAAD